MNKNQSNNIRISTYIKVVDGKKKKKKKIPKITLLITDNVDSSYK